METSKGGHEKERLKTVTPRKAMGKSRGVPNIYIEDGFCSNMRRTWLTRFDASDIAKGKGSWGWRGGKGTKII